MKNKTETSFENLLTDIRFAAQSFKTSDKSFDEKF